MSCKGTVSLALKQVIHEPFSHAVPGACQATVLQRQSLRPTWPKVGRVAEGAKATWARGACAQPWGGQDRAGRAQAREGTCGRVRVASLGDNCGQTQGGG